jgi:DNA-nicking Smr family endonuclease
MKRVNQRPECHRPFENLSKLASNAGMRFEKVPPPPEPAPAPDPQPEDEAVIFDRAMNGVSRASWRHRPLAPAEPVKPKVAETEPEGFLLMQAAVNGDPALLVSDHPEYIEGWIGVAGRRYLPNLRNGIYSIQAQLDLHGRSREEARMAVEEFIERLAGARSCCVKIIHGRGINSPNDRAVLKENLQRWLCTRRMSRHVVAFASAPFIDGGVGAIYVLLRTSRPRAG